MTADSSTLVATARRVESALATSLVEAADGLDALGRPAERALHERIGHATRVLSEFDHSVRGEEADPGTATLDALTRLQEERSRTRAGLRVIEHLLALEHIRDPEFPSLRELHAAANDLAASNDAARLGDVARESHVWYALALLTGLDGEPSDEAWSECLRSVRDGLPEELATAAARGRLAVAPEPLVVESAVAESAVPPPVVEPAPRESEPPTYFDEPPSDFDSDPGVPPAPRVETPDPDPPAGEQTLEDIEASFGEYALDESGPSDPEQVRFDVEPIRAAAEERTATPSTRTTTGDPGARDVLIGLIVEGRESLACQLARVREARGAAASFPPTWLLESLAVAHLLRTPNGRIARHLERTWDGIEPESGDRLDSERRSAYRLLVRAASLWPAVVAPSSGACRILRSVRMDDDLFELHNYCSSIAEFGLRHGGIDPTRAQSAASTPSPTPLGIAEETQSWLDVIGDRTVRYSRTTQVFLCSHWSARRPGALRFPAAARTWREATLVLGAVHAALGPVLANETDRWRSVEDAIRRLSRTETREPGLGLVIEEAVDLATRWARAAASETGETVGGLTPEAMRLRDELLERDPRVRAQLAQLVEGTADPAVRAAADRVLASLDGIASLLKRSRTFSEHEPDPRLLLEAELLKIPEFSTNVALCGQPTENLAGIEAGLTRLANGSAVTWVEAFDERLTRGDLAGARRILDLDLLSETDHADCTSRFEELADQGQDRLLEEIAGLRQRIAEGVKNGESDETNFARLKRILENLERRTRDSNDVTRERALFDRVLATMDTVEHEDRRTDEPAGGDPPADSVLDFFDDDVLGGSA